MTRPRILFVDDEQNILTGLRRTLWPMRGKREFEFALSDKEAMAKLI